MRAQRPIPLVLLLPLPSVSCGGLLLVVLLVCCAGGLLLQGDCGSPPVVVLLVCCAGGLLLLGDCGSPPVVLQVRPLGLPMSLNWAPVVVKLLVVVALCCSSPVRVELLVVVVLLNLLSPQANFYLGGRSPAQSPAPPPPSVQCRPSACCEYMTK